MNSFTVSHSDKAMMERFVKAFKEGALLQEFIPMPAELSNTTSPSNTTNEELISKYGSDNWYDWCIQNWGTKWDINVGDIELDEEFNEARGWFDSAWGPPIEAYRQLTKQGFDVNVMYHEPGMSFVGRFTSDSDDECTEYDFSNENWRDDIFDIDLVEMLESDYESYLEYLEEDRGE
jgi:hypothetical protein